MSDDENDSSQKTEEPIRTYVEMQPLFIGYHRYELKHISTRQDEHGLYLHVFVIIFDV